MGSAKRQAEPVERASKTAVASLTTRPRRISPIAPEQLPLPPTSHARKRKDVCMTRLANRTRTRTETMYSIQQ
jgi:hypothetical protein